MIQANQQSTTVDCWPFYEFQIYVDLLNKRNKEKAAKEGEANKNTDSTGGLMNKIGNLANRFKSKK